VDYRFHARVVTDPDPELAHVTAVVVDIFGEDDHRLVIVPVVTWSDIEDLGRQWDVPEVRLKIDADARADLDARAG